LERLRQTSHSNLDVRLVDYHGSDASIVSAARVSYGDGSKGEERDRKLIRYLLANGHTSPFEHVSITFHAKVPLFVARQWMRHRTWSFNEISYRYTEPTMEFYRPQQYRLQSSSNKQMSDGILDDAQAELRIDTLYSEALRHAEKAYNEMIEAGVSREIARMVLPVSLFTEFYATVNLHNLLKFFEQRMHPHAQEEIQNVAELMYMRAKGIVPWTIQIWEELKWERKASSPK